MPKGERFRLKTGKTVIDLSQEQFLMLQDKSLIATLPVLWKDQQRLNGLTKAGLIAESRRTRNRVTYKRTPFGGEVFDAISARKNKEN